MNKLFLERFCKILHYNDITHRDLIGIIGINIKEIRQKLYGNSDNRLTIEDIENINEIFNIGLIIRKLELGGQKGGTIVAEEVFTQPKTITKQSKMNKN